MMVDIFKESAKYPKDKDNSRAVYSVSWEVHKGGKQVRSPSGGPQRTGNEWSNKAYAQEVYERKEAEGLNPEATVSYYT